LIGQRVNASLQKALDVAISRFEAGDITGIVVSNNIFFGFFIILLSWYVNCNVSGILTWLTLKMATKTLVVSLHG
jgi:hypothetical protein